jgi:hypothetical protein
MGDRSLAILEKLTDEEIEALRVFSTLYGRNWRTHLRNQWMSGYAPAFESFYPMLQSVRNKIGPSGLCDIRTIHLQSLAHQLNLDAAGETRSEMEGGVA